MLQQVLQPCACLSRYGHGDDIAAPLFDYDIALRQLLLGPVRVGVRQVDLVDGDYYGHASGLGVVDRLQRLGHHAIVRSHNQDGDVSGSGAAGAHGRERLVPRRVHEGDLLALNLYLVGADVLGDAAGLLFRYVGLTNGVQNARLAVVDVAHDGDDGCPRL